MKRPVADREGGWVVRTQRSWGCPEARRWEEQRVSLRAPALSARALCVSLALSFALR